MQMSFSALIVKDIDQSISWYHEMLGFEVVNRNESQERGFKQANLKSGNMFLELIELASAVVAEDVVPDYSDRTLLRGIFKIGFSVGDFDRCLGMFRDRDVEFVGDVLTDPVLGVRMFIIRDPDRNRLQFFEKK